MASSGTFFAFTHNIQRIFNKKEGAPLTDFPESNRKCSQPNFNRGAFMFHTNGQPPPPPHVAPVFFFFPPEFGGEKSTHRTSHNVMKTYGTDRIYNSPYS
jgi:hypothetical protein